MKGAWDELVAYYDSSGTTDQLTLSNEWDKFTMKTKEAPEDLVSRLQKLQRKLGKVGVTRTERDFYLKLCAILPYGYQQEVKDLRKTLTANRPVDLAEFITSLKVANDMMV